MRFIAEDFTIYQILVSFTTQNWAYK